MEMPPLAVHRWPAAGAPIAPQHGLLIIAVDTQHSTQREEARRLVRAALAELLGAHLGCPAAAVRLVSHPGQPLRLDRPDTRIGLSVSHEPGLSLAVAHLAGPVGIDLLQVPRDPGWLAEIPLLARDYLGPEIAAQIAALPADERAFRFAREWTALEAGLKCLGSGLDEWSPALQQRLAGCRRHRLQLPGDHVGAVAVPSDDTGRP
ncbi:MAG: 4'-phosphopantetheinyl transferase superfamily protein [Zoogloea sp.]|nr:4'-phosphopantetheinyl transferase superfamily protein [Zoogloea sp.]